MPRFAQLEMLFRFTFSFLIFFSFIPRGMCVEPCNVIMQGVELENFLKLNPRIKVTASYYPKLILLSKENILSISQFVDAMNMRIMAGPKKVTPSHLKTSLSEATQGLSKDELMIIAKKVFPDVRITGEMSKEYVQVQKSDDFSDKMIEILEPRFPFLQGTRGWSTLQFNIINTLIEIRLTQ